ncbi:MAG: hypothetical protein Q9228_006534 [Teloschistes exilis]
MSTIDCHVGDLDDSNSWYFREDAIPLMRVQNTHLAAQVITIAQDNVKWLSYVLLHGDINDSHKPTTRDYLRYAENAVRPGPAATHQDTLDRLKSHSATVRRWLEEDLAKPIPDMVKRQASVILQRDLELTISYLQHLLLLRYQHTEKVSERVYPQLLKWERLKPLSMYLEYKRTEIRPIAVALAQYAGIHPVELDREFGGRVHRLLRTISVDSKYVESRLIELGNLWGWASAYNRMANTGRWDELAVQFFNDKRFLNDIYPGPCVHACPERGIPQSNDKARVYIGIIMLQGHFFTNLKGPTQYKLSKDAASMKQRYENEQKRLRKEQRKQEKRYRRMVNKVTLLLNRLNASSDLPTKVYDMSVLRASSIFRPFPATRFTPRSQFLVFQQQRSYAGQDYGGGQGDPKGETPEKQGSNPSADKEHPGPPPPDVGRGTGGGPTKAHEGGHNTQQNESSSGGSKQSGAKQSTSGPQPKIHAENTPAEENDDVKAHNEDMAKRHDRANAEVDSKGETVEKGFWKITNTAPNMRFSLSSLFVVALAAESTVASSWFTKAAYNKWHETELERWLSDHNVPYPSPADRKDLENLVKSNWQSKIATPYNDWDPAQLQSYVKSKGVDVKKGTESNKQGLVSQVQGLWHESADTATNSYTSVKDWIFDGWTDSQLKAFLDKHDIPAPQPRKRDSLLYTARSNFESIAKKTKQTALYPGDWLYETWSESDLKEFLDERGVPVPQPSTRDKLIASVRRNSRLSAINAKDTAASASASAKAAKESLSDALLESWSDSKIKEWADSNGIKVPQGSKRNELIALARKHRDTLTGDKIASSASSAFGAATSNVQNQYAQATDDASLKSEDAFNQAVGTWSDSRLKAFLDARGVPVPQGGKKDELVKQVRLNKHKAASGYSAWTFDTWTTENLKNWLSTQNNKAGSKAGATRDDLLKQAQDSYASASKSGGSNYASVTSYLASATDSAKDSTFDTWSDSELKSYLDSYGVPNYQGSTSNELKAMARRNANYFRYGTSTPQGTLFARLQGGAQWVFDQLKIGVSSGRQSAGYEGEKAGDAIKEGATTATHHAGEAAQRVGDKAKEEL